MGKLLFVRQVAGKSMTPALAPGRYVFVTGLIRPTVGHVVVISHNNKEKIKRISDIEDSHVHLTGDNAEFSTDSRQFGPIPDELIVGVVVWPRIASSQHPDQAE